MNTEQEEARGVKGELKVEEIGRGANKAVGFCLLDLDMEVSL